LIFDNLFGELKMEHGKCANCGSGSIDYINFLGYGASELKIKSVGYHYRCEDCGHEGVEWYIMKYERST